MSDMHKSHIRRDELHERILNQASVMFQQKGIKQVKMDDIASSLSISKRTLYETYRNKKELLIECILLYNKQKEDYIKEIAQNADNVLEIMLKSYLYDMRMLHLIHQNFFKDMKKYPEVINHFKRMRENNHEKAVNFFRKGVEQGLLQANVNIEIFMRLFTIQCDSCFENVNLQQYPFTEVYHTIMLTSLRGIATESGQQYLDKWIYQNF